MLHLRPNTSGARICFFWHPRVHDIDAVFPLEEDFLATHVVHNDTTAPPEDHSVTVVTKFADRVQWLRNGSYLIRCVVSISTLRHRVDTLFSSV